VVVDEQTMELAGTPVFYRQAEPSYPATVYLHSVPTSSDDWLDLLERTGGVAVDLPGFGRSGKGGHLDYTLPGYVTFLGGFLDALGIQDVRLVGHGWGGAIALSFAQLHPQQVERLVLVDPVPLLDGFTWPPLIGWLRRPGVGELILGSANRRLLGRSLRKASGRPDAWTPERLERIWEQFDEGTLRAVLRLHRSLDPQGLTAAGLDLEQIDAPTLLVWGEADPWLPASFGARYAERLPQAELELVPGAGHWPWLDEPALIGRIADFLQGGS
jgi:pimeloyl-ACP methyl ester carboxylesterase